MNDHYLVLTPEKVVLSYRPCGLATRIGAHVLDVLLAMVCATAVSTIIALGAPVIGETAAMMVGSLLAAITFLAYFVLFEGLGQGQTPGKRVAKARVVMIDGTPVTFSAALFRNLLRPADFLPGFYLVGALCLFMNPRSQRLGDLAAGTVVIAERPAALGYSPAPHHVGVHRLESTVGDLRTMTLEEYHAIKRLVDRFPFLPPETQEWSVLQIWRPFAERHKIQPAPGSHAIYQMEAVVMKFGRMHNLV